MTIDKRYDDNELNDFHKFIQMIFIKHGDFKTDSFTGIQIYSQQLRSCFGKEYKTRVIEQLIALGVLSNVCNWYDKINGKCKVYKLEDKVRIFYPELCKRVRQKDFTGFRSKKRIQKFITERYEDSLNYFQFSLSDCRIHSPWVTLPSDWRHNYITKDGKFLVCDLDLKTAYWSMLAQFVFETLEEFRNTELNLEYNQLVYALKKDIYTYFLEKSGLCLSRDKIKEPLCSILNTSRNQLFSLNRADKEVKRELYNTFKKQFPLLSEWVLDANEGDNFLGYLFAQRYESKVIVGLIRNLQNYHEFRDTDLIPVFDGIEFFQSCKLTERQKEILQQEIEHILSPYKHLKMEYKVIK